MKSDKDIETAAEYLCLGIYPEEYRGQYVTDIRAHYHADEITYVLQALSTGMTSVFVGLITSYLYDKAKKTKKNALDDELLVEYKKNILELQTLLAKEKSKSFKKLAQRQHEMHAQTLIRIQDSDPLILEMVEDALLQLEKRGQSELDEEIDSHN